MKMEKRWLTSLIGLLLITLVVACSSPAVETPDPAETTPEGQDVLPRPTITPLSEGEQQEEGYPAPIVPPTPTTPPGYPSAPTPLPTQDPYPSVEGFVWVTKPVGEQCGDGPTEPDLTVAVADLTAADVEVNESSLISLPVCTECGCPTSEHYRVQIAEDDVESATELGWTVEP